MRVPDGSCARSSARSAATPSVLASTSRSMKDAPTHSRAANGSRAMPGRKLGADAASDAAAESELAAAADADDAAEYDDDAADTAGVGAVAAGLTLRRTQCSDRGMLGTRTR